MITTIPDTSIDDQRSRLLVGVSKAEPAKKKLMSHSPAH
jgi:hypothetical protein